MVFTSMSTARRLAAGLRIFSSLPPAAHPFRAQPRKQVFELAVPLAQVFEFPRGIGVHPAVLTPLVGQRRRRHLELRRDLLLRLARSSELIGTAQRAHDVLARVAYPGSHVLHRPVRPAHGEQGSRTGWPRSPEICQQDRPARSLTRKDWRRPVLRIQCIRKWNGHCSPHWHFDGGGT